MSIVKEANNAFLMGEYQAAISLYRKAIKKQPSLKNTLENNIHLCQLRINRNSGTFSLKSINKLPITALVITWDIGHNPLGRSYMLAEALERAVKNVVICGFQFSKYGNEVWQPVRNGRLPVISLPGKDMSGWLNDCEKAVEKFKPDLVIACKPRLPSVELGILFKEKYKIPLIVDVDDHELSFFNFANPLSVDDILQTNSKNLAESRYPYDKVWTQLSDSLARDYADHIITSNTALCEKFGGTIIPHVRDEEKFNPDSIDKFTQRQKYGIPLNSKVVMFFGTPRIHKGVGEIAEAIGKLNDDKAILVVVGEAPDKNVTKDLDKLANGKFVSLSNQPFDKIPEIISMADLVILPQDVNHPISKYQLPAKAIDAIAMGIPLLVSNTKPMHMLVDDGVAKLLPDRPLDETIEEAFRCPPTEFYNKQLRERFLANYSYNSAAHKLKSLIAKVLKKDLSSLEGFSLLIEKQKTAFPTQISVQSQQRGIDVVLFWKQNDSGLYGRRSDMVIKYLASREDVKTITVFDSPVSHHKIGKWKTQKELTHNGDLYIKLYEKLLGKLDCEKVSYNVFTYPAGKYKLNDPENLSDSFFNHYKEYIENRLEKVKVDSNKAVFWFYPQIAYAEKIIDCFKPNRVVVDVVDDHREWPGVNKERRTLLTNHYRNLISKSNLTMANCVPVFNSMAEFDPKIKLIPNGCEKNPEICVPTGNTSFDEISEFKGKVIGFVGNLEAKIDIQLIRKVAKEFPDALIVLIGSTHANPEVRYLKDVENIILVGVVDYKYINAFVSLFHVGIIPHKKMSLTNSMNPLKAFVYLANRINVVASNIENLPASRNILVSIDHEDFINNLRLALSQDSDFEESFIKENSWDARFQAVVDTLVKESYKI